MLGELRKKAREIFGSNKWMASVTEGDRSVTVQSDGLYCSSMNQFDSEFTTSNVETAVNYLYPEY